MIFYRYPVFKPASFRHLAQVSNFRLALFRLKKQIQMVCKSRAKQHEIESMQHFIQRRCEDFHSNQSRMIDSMLERTKKKIVIDRIVVNNELITDPVVRSGFD